MRSNPLSDHTLYTVDDLRAALQDDRLRHRIRFANYRWLSLDKKSDLQASKGFKETPSCTENVFNSW